MPQMAPTMWVLLLLSTFIMLLFTYSFMYFNKNISVKKDFGQINENKKFMMTW